MVNTRVTPAGIHGVPRRALRGLSAAAIAFTGAALIAAPAGAQGLDLFVANQGNASLTNGGRANIGAFTIGPGGSLTPFADSPLAPASGGFPASPAITPIDEGLFTVDQVSSVDPFAIGAGSATPEPAQSTGADSGPSAEVISPGGRLLYVVDRKSKGISGFAISSTGTLAPLAGSPYPVPGGNPRAIAMTPDGLHVYVASATTGASDLAAFGVQPDGALTLIGSGYQLGQNTEGLRVTPDGRYLYASSADSTTPISAFEINSDGTLSKLGLAPSVFGSLPLTAPAIDRGGHRLYVGTANGLIYGYTIAAGGALYALPGSPYSGTVGSGYAPYDLEFTPDGAEMYAAYSDGTTTTDGQIATFAVQNSGALAPETGKKDTGGTEPGQNSIAITPDPGPVAALSAAGGLANQPSYFDAASSFATLEAYAPLTYSWSFGDGTYVPDGAPTATHSYARPGTYTATVTVTDGAGCSASLVWTGINSYCAGDPLATASATVAVPAPAITQLTQSRRRWREGTKLATISSAAPGRKPPVGTTFSVGVNEGAWLVLSFAQHATGRKLHGRCVALTALNRHRPTCKRTLATRTLKLLAHPGVNTITFDGRVNRRVKLVPGDYTVTVRATTYGVASAPRQLSFTIAGP